MTFRIRAILILFGVMLFVMGFRELQLRGLAKSAPQLISCENLADDGPGGNAFVRLSDYMLCDFDFVYASEDEAGRKWTDAWVPVVPSDGAYAREVQQIRAEYGDNADFPSPQDFNVILWLPSAKSFKDVSEAASLDALQGMVINKVDPLDTDERRYLEETYPQVDIRQCWVLQLGRRPAGMATLAGLFGGGTILIGACLLWIWLAHRRRTYDPRAGREILYPTPRMPPQPNPYAVPEAGQQPSQPNPYATASAAQPSGHNPYAPAAPSQGARPRIRVPKERS